VNGHMPAPTKRPLRVLVVDDHPVVLAGLVTALAQQPDIEMVLSASDREVADRLLQEHRIDVGLDDVRLQNGTGFDVIGDHPTEPGPAWIVLSSFESPQYLAAAIHAGAAGYLVKTTPLPELLEAIRRVATGGTAYLARQLRTAEPALKQSLSKRDRDVLHGILAGRSNDEIGLDLHIQRKTVESYLSRLYERFGVSSRTELALLAEREGWLDLPLARRDREPTARVAGE
jgi:DNA-binding NarL/FixJ family response regulator